MFSCEFCEISNKTFFHSTTLVAASDTSLSARRNPAAAQYFIKTKNSRNSRNRRQRAIKQRVISEQTLHCKSPLGSVIHFLSLIRLSQGHLWANNVTCISRACLGNQYCEQYFTLLTTILGKRNNINTLIRYNLGCTTIFTAALNENGVCSKRKLSVLYLKHYGSTLVNPTLILVIR